MAATSAPRQGSAVLTADEIDEIRAATPGCRDDLIHLNHAGSSLPARSVLDVQIAHLEREAMIGGYEAAGEAQERSEAVYTSIAGLIGAAPHEIARAEHATAAWQAAFWSLPMRAGQRLVTHDHDYGGNVVALLHAAATRGLVVERLPSDATGAVDLDALSRVLERPDDVAVVSLAWIPTNGGLVNPAAAVGEMTRDAGVPFLLDGCQAAGHLDVDVEALQCDFLSMTGRKFLRGPRGSGALYVGESMLDRVVPSHPDHHSAIWTGSMEYDFAPGARRYEHWEYSHAAWLGLGAAVEVARVIGMDRIEATIRDRADRLRTSLVECGFVVHDEGTDRCGIVTVSHPAVASEVLRDRLRHDGINTSCTSIDSTRFDVERRDLPVLLRLSVHCTTTDDELARVTSSVRHDVTRS